MPESHTAFFSRALAKFKPHWEPDAPRVEEFARRLHKLRDMHGADANGIYCLECAHPFPCDTVRVAGGIDGYDAT